MRREVSTRHTEEKLRHIPRLLVRCLQPNPLRAFRAKMGRLSVSGKNTTPYWPGIAEDEVGSPQKTMEGAYRWGCKSETSVR